MSTDTPSILTLRVKEALALDQPASDAIFLVRGWLRSLKKQSQQAFGHLFDGSAGRDLQCVFLKDRFSEEQWQLVRKISNGSSIACWGKLVPSPATGQKYELCVDRVELYGDCPSATYPLIPKKGYTMDYIRKFPHLRPRTRVISAVARIRNALSWATHQFFQQQDFIYLHTPLITGSDCEGGGETFEVRSEARLQRLTEDERIELKKTDLEQFAKRHHFFGQPAYLTVSGQLDGEAYACAMGRIYTFGPTFRADNSNTSRHLAEFWMIEPEVAFYELPELMGLAQDYVQFCLRHVLEKCSEDLEFLQDKQAEGLLERLETIVKSDFPRVSYTQAIKMLQTAVKGHREQQSSDDDMTKEDLFEEMDIYWGLDLGAEHEKYLTEVCFGGQPIILHHYPSEIKAFYMYEERSQDLTDSQKATVRAMDLLVPGIGELIGGSQREVDLDILLGKMKKFDLDPEEYEHYLDLRKYGNVPHSGFGLGFERLVMLATGIRNIRDVIPFPRYVGHL